MESPAMYTIADDPRPRRRHVGQFGLACRISAGFRQPKVNDFGSYIAPLLDIHHDVAWFDVPMNQLLFVDGSQTDCGLCHDFERQLCLKPVRALD
jgi:hypothetical protein